MMEEHTIGIAIQRVPVPPQIGDAILLCAALIWGGLAVATTTPEGRTPPPRFINVD